ncbi:MAG TPA: HlyD family efflux transporter periplasmic adaptor subunit [Candidatus Binataceae bacterium]|nr:HlyD family efflux transporter periplasmic adaptor subunit [Candidatus Binataceae bacterium]
MMEGSPGLIDPVLPRVGVLVARGTFYLIGTVLVVTIAWLSLTRVNIVVRAEGHLAPRAEPMRLSVPQGGIISRLLVDVGSQVNAGQPLLELDSFRETADANQDRHELEQAKAESEKYSENARILEAATGNIKQELASEQQVATLVSKQVEELRGGFVGGGVSLFEVQIKERDLAETHARIAQLSSDLNRSEAEARQDRWNEAQTSQKIQGLEIKLARDSEIKQKTILRAPVAGTVAYIASLRPGRYLGSNEVAATIIPGSDPLLAEVWIPNDSMRRVRPSLPVRMKLKAYPYQQFGLLPGTLISVDPDANESGSYRAWIKPDRLTLGGHNAERLRPGLALTSEIVVDQRTLLDVILDPVRRVGRGFALSQ